MVEWTIVLLLLVLVTGLAFRIAWMVPFRWLKVVMLLLACGFLGVVVMHVVSFPL